MNPAVVSGLLCRRTGLATAKRCMGSPAPWNYLWKPAAYADTDEKRIAAAKKYGMLPEDYVQYDPVTEADMMCGDYPKLPVQAEMHKDPYYPWDDPRNRRNYGEPMHESWNLYTEERFTPMDGVYRYTRREMMTCQLLWCIFLGVCYYIFEKSDFMPRLTRCVMEKQLNPKGKDEQIARYTFEVPE